MSNTDQIQTNANQETESSELQHGKINSGPINITWHFKRVDGFVNVIANPDGTYLFSGDYKQNEPGKDLDIAFALRSRLGGMILMHFVGDASHGAKWSMPARSDTLKDNFNTFAEHDWSVKYDLHLSAEGRAKLYEEQERKAYEEREQRKEELRKAEDAARQQKDEKLAAEKKAARAEEEQKERAEVQHAEDEVQRAATSNGGGGSSVGSTVGDVVKTVGTVAGVVGSILAFI